MRKILRIALLFASFFICARSMAQTGGTVVRGTVADDKGITLPGVTVTVKDAKVNAITNIDGNYTITVPAGSRILVFSFIGMQQQEITIGSRTQIDVTLKSSTTSLTDVNVVAIGYGSQRRQDVNGAISSVKASDIANIPQPSIDQMLQGKAAGLTITQNSGAPGSSTSVRVRGVTSLSLSNEPLYVIDGVPISGDATNKSTSGRSPQLNNVNNDQSAVSPLALINPSDIESIDVLKDASATAIYGSRASNGVIIITTKRGKNGGARVAYDGYAGFQEQGKFLDMMKLPQYATLQNALADAQGTQRRSEFADPSLLGPGTNWQEEIFRTAPMQNHQLSFSGAKDGVDYYISGGYLKQLGTILGNDFNRYNFRTNVNGQVKEWFKVGAAISGNRSNQNVSIGDNNGVIYGALLSAPDQSVRNADGTFSGPLPEANQQGGQINPVARALDIYNNLVRSNVNASIYADTRFYKDLSLRSELNGDFNWSNAKVFQPSYAYGPYNVNPTAKLNVYNANSNYWGWKEYLNYNHTFGTKHAVTGLLGYEVNESNWGGIDAGVQSFLSNDLKTLNLGDAKTATNGEYKDGQSLESQFARAIYTYNNRYSITATIRRDKSSKFAEGHQVGYFPSFAVSWRLSEEPFLASVKSVADNIKLRVGYGQVGNQSVPNYLYGSALNSLTTGLGTGFTIDKVANPNLTWETAIQTDIGVDFSLFGRIDASFDYFDKTSKNFLFQAALPAFLLGQSAEYSGTGVINPPFINGGKLYNRGFEFTINSRNIAEKNFKWNTTVIFSKYKNRVVSLAEGVPFINRSVGVSFLSLPVTRTTVGGPVGEFYGYKVKGIFKTAEQLRTAPTQFGRPVANNSGGTYLGDIQYEDLNNDGKIDEADQTSLGSGNPKFTYGITNSFTYKSVDLSFFLNGSYGAKIFNVLNYSIAGLSGLYQNQLASVSNFWTPTNSDSNIPTPRGGDNPNLKNSDRFIESGSFLRIQNVSIGYSLPSAWIKKVKLNRLRVYASGQNLYVFTPYKGLDPEIGSLNQDAFLTGVDVGRYPAPRTITFGINAEF
ncbi:SusC/RagA family TonB-linked outer membrane protein [Mucilaginibacter gilvus]|uniref:TonB-dependent receptor n=1 Tax=Mucilaginibacter gilvus TaxID=2305909 RepID=A0A444MT69_9SPHI|nr:TonB-dependent receptor [Mucilaginibacter gilvus]RWY55819.1 TonB-dependent receptor [Mucilaginibacter gilvus]